MKPLSFLKEKRKALLFSFINSVVLVILTFTWINKSYILTDDEEYLIKGTTSVKDVALQDVFKFQEPKPNPDDFLFVNISWEKQLTYVKDLKNGQVIGQRAITNRKHIARFLKLLNKNPQHKFILLDVWFKDSSDYFSDSLLQAELLKTKNILIPYHKVDNNDHAKDLPIFQGPVALSDYEKDDMDNNFCKFRLVQGDNFKTTPLVMYEQLHGKSFKEGNLLNYMGNSPALNSFILKIRLSNIHLNEEKEIAQGQIGTVYNKLQLIDLIGPEVTHEIPEMDNTFINTILNNTKNKIVVIGDFEDSDIHQTIYGPTPGPLILLNVYLALVHEDNILHLNFLLFLFLGFFLISYKCFGNFDFIDNYFLGRIVTKNSIRTYVAGFIDYLIYFIVLSILSYFLFNVHLTILLLALYMEFLDRLLRHFESKKSLKEQSDLQTISSTIP
jgi:hypothetical protein